MRISLAEKKPHVPKAFLKQFHSSFLKHFFEFIYILHTTVI